MNPDYFYCENCGNEVSIEEVNGLLPDFQDGDIITCNCCDMGDVLRPHYSTPYPIGDNEPDSER